MAQFTVLVHYNLSPRIIQVMTEEDITVQDLYSSVRSIEDEPAHTSFPNLIRIAGGEALGGGVTVGYTAELQNAQVYFSARSTPLLSGLTCDTTDTRGKVFSGGVQDYSGVSIGDTIFNNTTGGMATIIDVDDAGDELTHLTLSGGSNNQWTSGDGASVYQNVQCNIQGGNLVAVDTAGDPLDPVLQSPNVQVVRTASSSATNQELSAIQYSSFQNGVTIDTTSGTAGTIYPIGTSESPVSNWADAKTIAMERGFSKIYVIGNLNITTGQDVSGYTFVGESHVNYTIDFDAGATVDNVNVNNLQVTGTVGDNFHLEEGIVNGVSGLNGHIHHSSLKGTISLGGSLPAYFFDCSSVDQDNPVIIDMGGTGAGCALSMPNYSGLITVSNCDDATIEVGIGLNAGAVIVSSDVVTCGTFTVAGLGSLIDNSSVTINSDGLMNKTNVSESVNDQIRDIAFRVESLRERGHGYGNLIFYDPVNGDDANDGSIITVPVLTFARAMALATSGNNDIIQMIDTDSGTETNIDEQWVINKDDVRVRGAGWGMLLNPQDDNGEPAIKITGKDCALENFQVRVLDGASTAMNCIEITGSDTTTLKNMKVKRSTNDSIVITDSDVVLIEGSIIEHNTSNNGRGITVAGTSHECVIKDCFVYDCTTDIHFTGTSYGNTIEHCVIHQATTGIEIDGTCGVIYIRGNNILTDNTTDISDATTNALVGQDLATHAVWDMPLMHHQTAGTTGKKLDDIPDEQVFTI